MKTEYIDIPKDKWGVLLIYDFDESDERDLYAIMRSFNMSERNINKSLTILSTHNSGMAVSNFDLRMSAMFIGKPTSITEYYDEPCNGEAIAYLQGYIFQCNVEQIAEPKY